MNLSDILIAVNSGEDKDWEFKSAKGGTLAACRKPTAPWPTLMADRSGGGQIGAHRASPSCESSATPVYVGMSPLEGTYRRYPSHMARNAKKRVKNPKRPPAEAYDRGSYGLAIDRACDKAFPPPAPLAQRDDETAADWWNRLDEKQREAVMAWRKAHRWHPNQLRHTFATRVRKEHGLEAAQVLLGHTRADVTQVYAERDQQLATTIAAKIG